MAGSLFRMSASLCPETTPQVKYHNNHKGQPRSTAWYRNIRLRSGRHSARYRNARLPESGYAFVWLSPACQQPARQKSHFVATFS